MMVSSSVGVTIPFPRYEKKYPNHQPDEKIQWSEWMAGGIFFFRP
jgi:hypothetical protein